MLWKIKSKNKQHRRDLSKTSRMIRQEQNFLVVALTTSFNLVLLATGIMLVTVGRYFYPVLIYVGLTTVGVACIVFVALIVKIVSKDKNSGYNTGATFTKADQDPEVGLLHKTNTHNVNETAHTANTNEPSTSEQGQWYYHIW